MGKKQVRLPLPLGSKEITDAVTLVVTVLEVTLEIGEPGIEGFLEILVQPIARAQLFEVGLKTTVNVGRLL
jgi:hypothetical protein